MNNSDDIIEEVSENAQSTSEIQHKLDIMSMNNGWNDKNERIVISVGENAAAYKWMHEKSAANFKALSQIFSIIQIIISTLLSAETIIPSSNTSTSIDILRRILVYMMTVLSILQNFLKYEELSERHNSASNSFGHLYHEIQEQMCMYRRYRHNATKYVSLVLKQYDSFVVNGPSIEKGIINKFKSTFQDTGISMPDVADKIQRIEIITEPKIENKFCNLNTIHNAFQIHGDITDKDIENTSAIELKQLRTKFFNEKAIYEYNRYIQHNSEFD
jgi:hypothetical protein